MTELTLTPKQEAMIVALLDHPTQEAAARAVGVSRMTLHRWLKQDAFLTAYQAARRDRFRRATDKLTTRSQSAIDALYAVVEDPASPATARVAAAKAAVEMAYKLVELEEMNVRMTRMEKAFGH